MNIKEKDYNATINFEDLTVGDIFQFQESIWMKTELISNMQVKINAVVLKTGTFDHYFNPKDEVGVIQGSFVEE